MMDPVERAVMRGRSRWIRIMGWVGLVVGSLYGLSSLAFLIADLAGTEIHSDSSPAATRLVMGLVVLVCGCMAVLGRGLLGFRDWARKGTIVFLVVWGLVTPVVSGIGMATTTDLPNPLLAGLTGLALSLVICWLVILPLIRYLRKDRTRALFSAQEPR